MDISFKDQQRTRWEEAQYLIYTLHIPQQWEVNAQYIGRYGTIDAFYFDFYSIALSKIQRGSTRDINDVRLLLQQHVITLQSLDAAYKEVLPQVGKRPYNRLDPKQFAVQYTTIRQLLENEEH